MTGRTCSRPKTTGAVMKRLASWRAVLAGGDTFGFADILQNSPAGGDVGQAGIRQRRAPAAADQQPGAEISLKVQSGG